LTGRNRGASLATSDSEAMMRKTAVVICEVCGGTKASGTADFLLFHCLAFCSPDCLDGYRTDDEERRAKREAAASRKTSRAA
jgi:hypothetical protein